jgi:hypothetical protein
MPSIDRNSRGAEHSVISLAGGIINGSKDIFPAQRRIIDNISSPSPESFRIRSHVAWINTLDRTPKKSSGNRRKQDANAGQGIRGEFSEVAQSKDAEEVVWLPPRDSNPDMLIQSQLSCR